MFGDGAMPASHSPDIGVRAEFVQTKTSPVVDQEQSVINLVSGGVLAIGSNSNQKLAQVITAGITGNLVEIRLAVACAEEIDLTVDIQGASNDKPNGVVLSSGTFTSVGPYESPPLLKSLPLPRPVFFNAGDRFAIVLEATPNAISFCSTYPGPSGNPYPGGDAFYGTRLDPPDRWVRLLHSPGMNAGVDLPFQTVVRPAAYRLTVTEPLNGAVTGKEIECPGTCSSVYYPDDKVVLNAVADTGFVLSAWSGCDTVKGNKCTVTMTTPRSVTATFTSAPVTTLTVRKEGTGTGTVRSADGDIDCGAVCGAVVAMCPGTHGGPDRVTLYAVSDPGSAFSGWSDGCMNGDHDNYCVLCIGRPTTVTATFNRIPPMRTLVVRKEGSGKGTVNSVPDGITCGQDCGISVPLGTVVTLAATADAGSVFSGWSGCDSVRGDHCRVIMSASRTVTARFTRIPPKRTLVVQQEGSGKGTVNSIPDGISCGTDCSYTYDPGTAVTLSAVPDPGYTFMGWSGGGCAGTGSCVVTLWDSALITARFECVLPLPSKQDVLIYEAMIMPAPECSVSGLRPIGVGLAAVGHPLFNLAVDMPGFEEKVDYYLAFYAPDLDPENVYLMNSAGGIEHYKGKLIPWMTGVEGSVLSLPWVEVGYLFGIAVPTGQYHVGLLVVPKGGTLTGPYYFWMTSFAVR